MRCKRGVGGDGTRALVEPLLGKDGLDLGLEDWGCPCHCPACQGGVQLWAGLERLGQPAALLPEGAASR